MKRVSVGVFLALAMALAFLAGLKGRLFHTARETFDSFALAANPTSTSTAAFKPLIVDSGCSIHMVNDKTLFTSFDHSAIKRPILVAGGAQTIPTAVGTVECTVIDTQGAQQRLKLTNVSYAPTSPFNLVSVSKLLEDKQCCNPDFAGRTWDLDGPGTIPISFSRGLYTINWDALPSPTCAAGTTQQRPRHSGTVDWQFARSELRRWLPHSGNATGTIDVDLFTDGKGPVHGNSQADVFYSLANDAMGRYVRWTGKAFYANPPWIPDMLLAFFKKQNDDMEFSPEHTSMLAIVPDDPTAVWYPWTLKWEVLHRYPAGTQRIFTRPIEGVLKPGNTTDSGDEGGPNRVFIGGCPVPVLVLFRNANTPIRSQLC